MKREKDEQVEFTPVTKHHAGKTYEYWHRIQVKARPYVGGEAGLASEPFWNQFQRLCRDLNPLSATP
jgi:hypothetical protein